MSAVPDHLLDETARRIRALPEVGAAVAVPRGELRRPTTAEPGPTRANPERTAEQPRVIPDGLPPAEVHGGDLVFGEDDPVTLQDALRDAADRAPGRGTTYLKADGSEQFQSYRDLLADAERLLAGLRTTGIEPGDSVLFQFADNRNFVTAFWACVLGGYLPTPVGVAPSYHTDNAVTRKLRNAWELLDRPLVLTDADLLPGVRGLAALWAEEPRAEAVEALAATGTDTDTGWYPASPDDPVLHLLTSGSTGTPKCVRHHHRSILARTRATALANGFDQYEVSLNWMPLDHVGGIVMYNVRDVVLRCAHVNAETAAFLADPPRWLDWADRFGATNTWAPNFAFALVNEAAARMADRHWDLSRLRHICNAGEAVVPRTAHRFLRLLRPHGLPPEAMRPCWGMSETSSGITYSTLSADDEHAGTVRAAQRSLGGGPLVTAAEDDADGVTFTEVGPPVPGVRLRVTDAEDTVLPERHVGRLQVTGPTMMAGYHRNPEANRESFTADGWFNTGDLAFLDGGRLTITGREKDVVIIRGANYLTYDIESVVELVDGVETTFVAACGYTPDGAQAEELAVFFVPATDQLAGQRAVVREVRATLARDLGLHADLVIPVDRTQFPKTNSGKIQRAQLLADLHDGAFTEQLARLEAEDEPETFFERVWIPGETPGSGQVPGGVWLLFADQATGIEDAVLPLAGGTVVVVRPGPEFGRPRETTFTVNPDDREHLRRLLAEVRRDLGPVSAVCHALAMGSPPRSPLDGVRDYVLSVLAVLHELRSEPVPLLVLTTGAIWAGPGDRVEPVRTALPGLLRTALAEENLPLLRQLDLPADAPGRWPDAIRAELADTTPEAVVAYREGNRLVPRLRALDAESGTAVPFAAGGTYLVTGGLGGIGHLVSEYLLAAYGAKLLMLGRTPLEDSPEKAARAEDLAALGEIEYRTADVADPSAVRAAAEHAENRWGQPLSGVLHLAGADIGDHWQELESHALAAEEPAGFRRAYRAKLFGTLTLRDLLADRPDTALVLFSSVNAEFGGRSFGAYSSANSFLNGFADHWAHERGRPVYSLSWSMWPGIGMNRGTAAAAAESRGFRALTEETGIAALHQALALARPNLLIGLDPGNAHIVRELVPDQLGVAEIVVAYTSAEEVDEARLLHAAGEVAGEAGVPLRFVRFDRLPEDTGELLTALPPASGARRAYAEPTTELERALAAIWSEVLGRPRIGRDDSFFEVGGNSVRAVQIASRIGDAVGVRFPVHRLYQHPTVSQLAEQLAED